MGVVQGIWASADPWELVSITVVITVLLAVVLVCTRVTGQLTRLDRGDKIVLLFCGSKKEPGIWPSDGAGAFPFRHSRFEHVATDDLSPGPIGRVLSDR
jgi:SBF-like CPA transporter family (DUF4137)